MFVHGVISQLLDLGALTLVNDDLSGDVRDQLSCDDLDREEQVLDGDHNEDDIKLGTAFLLLQ